MMAAEFKPCLLIPVYNHGSLIAATLQRLECLGLPCLLVDDGSEEATASVLRELADSLAWVTLITLYENQGKGVAVLSGIAEARRLGYTHAVQVDADGQHAVEDVPRMLAMAELEPGALISGAPVYDDSVPAARLYGRYITHFWVWVETLSLSIVDSMCGFRVYPVVATNDLAQQAAIGRRMDFDTDIMVRLYWRGVPVRFLKTRVHYPEDGISHFDLWRDNLRISRMHTRLVIGMIPRIPLLLWRRLLPTSGADQGLHWSEVAESGAYLGMATCVVVYRILGRRALYAMLYPIIAYYFLSNRSARRVSAQFLARVHAHRIACGMTDGSGPQPGLASSFRQFMNFGRSIVDRIGAWSGDIRRDQVKFPGREQLLEYIQQRRGGIILSSHLGNMEMMRGLVDDVQHVKMNVLVFNDNAAQINRLMKRVNPRVDVELIQIRQVGPDTAMMLKNKLDSGEFIVIAADRTSPTVPEKCIPAQFMGAESYFPQGSFILAGLLECPVLLMFCLSEGSGYHIHLEPFADPMQLPRKLRQEKLAAYAQQYASRLETYALKAPEQWYNFFDFWKKPEPMHRQRSRDKAAIKQA